MTLLSMSSPFEGSGVKTADTTMMSHSLSRASSYEVTRLGKKDPGSQVGGSPVSQPRRATV